MRGSESYYRPKEFEGIIFDCTDNGGRCIVRMERKLNYEQKIKD